TSYNYGIVDSVDLVGGTKYAWSKEATTLAEEQVFFGVSKNFRPDYPAPGIGFLRTLEHTVGGTLAAPFAAFTAALSASVLKPTGLSWKSASAVSTTFNAVSLAMWAWLVRYGRRQKKDIDAKKKDPSNDASIEMKEDLIRLKIKDTDPSDKDLIEFLNGNDMEISMTDPGGGPKEILLRCGEASLSLKSTGQISVNGTVLSLAATDSKAAANRSSLVLNGKVATLTASSQLAVAGKMTTTLGKSSGKTDVKGMQAGIAS
ncbi:MAG: hypothetical protein AAGC95_16630, partial [Pseudomonadota bacterium]